MDDSLDRLFSALADPTRRVILTQLARGEATVSEIGAPFGMSQPAISRHLKVLEAAGLIETSRSAQARPRRLNPDGFDAASVFISEMRSCWPDRFDRLDVYLKSQAQTKDKADD